MAKKLTDKEKVNRVMGLVSTAINAIETNQTDKISVITTKLYQAYAVLQSDKDDEFMITNLWIQLQHGGATERQLVLNKGKKK